MTLLYKYQLFAPGDKRLSGRSAGQNTSKQYQVVGAAEKQLGLGAKYLIPAQNIPCRSCCEFLACFVKIENDFEPSIALL
jgi:hypothetical protein